MATKTVTKKKSSKKHHAPKAVTTKQRPETTSRSAKIQTLVAMGLENGSVWAAMEQEYPAIIQDKATRLAVLKNKGLDEVPYDAELRKKVGWDINSTRALAIKDDDRVMSIVEATGGNLAAYKRVDELDMRNRHRFSWGVSALDFIYGQTNFVHLTDHEDSKYRTERRVRKQRDAEGNVHEVSKEERIWISGTWRLGDPMIPDGDGFVRTREADGSMVQDLDLRGQIVEHGCPEAFMSIWGGEPGVGKTRTAIKAGKAINISTQEPILYVNGEASEEDFRGWVGHDVDPELFRVVSATMLPVQSIVDMAYQLRPRVIFIDSVQTLAEWDKGNRGQKSALMILRSMMADVKAGKPHIVLISQLNKQNELKGARDLEHLADFVASVTKTEGRKGVFLFECPRKNRGGETPRGALFKHNETSIECISTGDIRSGPAYKLIQPTVSTVIAAGVTDPTPPPTDEGAGTEE